ncbi:MAG: bifunctional (p)ppGpp synthetase/guanosine-3',5'-bis(diphosphate) 3'-pyrophosphohydrolase [Ruminococcaceae bacterium]|nr:bifunctional (p)ppGpp synthetase/guanosine-3',5'-bis(diphosphate) 3'-pyrophosphohydrolase [Oscillospiraceae bacterium]
MESVQAHYDSMVEAIKKYAPLADMALIDEAFLYAEKMHETQKRRDGSPYIIHPLAVAEIIAEIGLDTDAILGALLHDCIEDTRATFDDIATRFGRPVAEMVEGVTKLTRVQYSTAEEQQMENLRKMFMAMSKDIRVIIIKIADRLHNTRTLEYQSPEKQIIKSMETMEIYAPLAYRLGMQKIKTELEDSSLRYLDPDGYSRIMEFLSSHKKEVDQFMNDVQSMITARLDAVGIEGDIYGRVKHVYSIYRKMDKQSKSLDDIYDLYAFRVIVGSISDCYNVLGHIHDLFNPVPGRFKDYISTPKPNMYQSLHTTVIGEDGIPFEVQIRTWEMHETAEYGVAAHWKYKQDGQGAGQEQQFEWVRRLLENQQDTDAEEYVHSLKIDMFDDEVFVFTPKGKVICLPAGSTPIDFAYAIHSGVGNSMVGAKINGRIASYDMELKNGDIVEVLTSKAAKGPSRDWLKLCHSNQARMKIKQWFKKERRDENIVQGRASIEAELKRMSVPLSVLQNEELLPTLLKKVSFDSLDDLYAAIGYGGITAVKAVNRIREELLRASRAQQQKENDGAVNPLSPRQSKRSDSGVIVEDFDSVLIKFSRCCTPVPGDDIVGFITKGYGVSIHRRDCPNAAHAADPEQAGRWVKVSWADTPVDPFSTSLEIHSVDRDGLMLDIAMVMTGLRLKVTELNARALPDSKCIISLTFEVQDVNQLNNVRNKIRMISGVADVVRSHG